MLKAMPQSWGTQGGESMGQLKNRFAQRKSITILKFNKMIKG